MDVLLIRADFTTENDTEIKICSPQSHVLSGYASLTLFLELNKFYQHSMFFLLLAKRKLATHKIWVKSTQDTLLLSAQVSVHHIWPTLLAKHCERAENQKERKNTFVLPTRHTSVSLRRPISCVWNKKVILLRDQGKMVKWFYNTEDQSKAEFFRLLNLRSIFLNVARKKGWDWVPRF